MCALTCCLKRLRPTYYVIDAKCILAKVLSGNPAGWLLSALQPKIIPHLMRGGSDREVEFSSNIQATGR
jgi:hypothetical protein